MFFRREKNNFLPMAIINPAMFPKNKRLMLRKVTWMVKCKNIIKSISIYFPKKFKILPKNKSRNIVVYPGERILQEVAFPRNIEISKKIAIEATIAAFPYHQSIKQIIEAGNMCPVSATPVSWEIVTWIQPLAKKVGLQINPKIGMLYDKSGFTAYLLQCVDSQEVRLIFGSEISCCHGKNFFESFLFKYIFWLFSSKKLNMRHLEQARVLATEVVRYCGHRKLVLSGHSQGGNKAVFASLSHNPPLPCYVFSSYVLPHYVLNYLPENCMKQVCEKIVHIDVKGDLLQALEKLFSSGVVLGKHMVVNSAHWYKFGRHYHFDKHINFFVESCAVQW